jgi:beta-1,4-mannosyl-glycoprotein beta-1,4-N-acetylglucosaminyltransferase
MKIIDCFTFYNEFELLKYRLSVLYDVVDRFVLVESTHTHAGHEKPLYFKENLAMFSQFTNKIVHVIVRNFPHKYPNINCEKDEQWINERFQRDRIDDGLQRIKLSNDDVITITDLDEIPDPRLLSTIKTNNISFRIYSLEMDMYYYNLNCRVTGEIWRHPKIMTYGTYCELDLPCSKLRFYNCEALASGGWHLSYFGSVEQIQNKIINFSHQEFNRPQFTDIGKISERIEQCLDIYGRENPVEYIPINKNNYLPVKYSELLTAYYKN